MPDFTYYERDDKTTILWIMILFYADNLKKSMEWTFFAVFKSLLIFDNSLLVWYAKSRVVTRTPS